MSDTTALGRPAAALEARYRAARAGATLLGGTDADVVEVGGRDRAAFLHAMLTNDVVGQKPGHGCEAAFLDAHGHVQALVLVLVEAERILLLCAPGTGAALLEGLDRFLFAEKVTLGVPAEPLTRLVLAGAGAAALAARLGAPALSETDWAHAAGTAGGVPAVVVRDAAYGGVSLIVTRGGAASLRAACADLGALPAAADVSEALRIEAGVLAWGTDVDPGVLLPELPLARLVSYTKGCYIGQELVVRVRDRGHVNRHLRGLVARAGARLEQGLGLAAEGREVGHVTSGAPAADRTVGLGYVRREHAAPGTRLDLAGGGRCVVTELPIPATATADA